MATWIAHLRIAEALLDRIPNLDPGQFAIGNIAPDSGIPDENWEKFTPPPEVTHFKRSKSVHKDIADLDFYRGYLADISPDDVGRFSFRLGYFFHLITDNLWTVKVGKPTQERFAEKFAADPKFIWEVKEDWYGLDQIYVREHPDCLFWRVFLTSEPASAELDFLPPAALPRQLRHIKEFYQRDDDEIKAMMARPMIYLSKIEMELFISDAIERIFAIYQILWPIPPVLNGFSSSLELLADEP
jgi:Zinc dependent phospholipase C